MKTGLNRGDVQQSVPSGDLFPRNHPFVFVFRFSCTMQDGFTCNLIDDLNLCDIFGEVNIFIRVHLSHVDICE